MPNTKSLDKERWILRYWKNSLFLIDAEGPNVCGSKTVNLTDGQLVEMDITKSTVTVRINDEEIMVHRYG